MSELSNVINEMRNMRESYDQLGAAAEAYNAGKSQLVENLNFKGVPASANETLLELADKVAQIAQTETILEGGEVMAAQQFGDGALWNLYQVLADMKTRFIGNGDYAALIVCEYYKGYDSLQLQGADCYYTCDGDLYEYASQNHVWHDSENGKANRWVAFLYRNEGARLDITNTAISPRSMYIGGHIGTIEYFVDGRLTDLVCGVEETDVVDNFLQKGFVQLWNRNTILRNVRNILKLSLLANTQYWSIVVNGLQETINNPTNNIFDVELSAQYISIRGLKSFSSNSGYLILSRNAYVIDFGDMEVFGARVWNANIATTAYGLATQVLLAKKAKRFENNWLSMTYIPNSMSLIDFWVGEVETNIQFPKWNPVAIIEDTTKKAQLIENIKNHILARVSDATGGTQLVFTVSTNMYNSIASETIEWQGETMTLADAFLTKNWLLAGA